MNPFTLALNRFCRAMRTTSMPDNPLRLDIIVSHRCNLNCVGCPHNHHDRTKDLEAGVFKKILALSRRSTRQYLFCSVGEPFINKEFPEILSLIAAEKIGCAVATNGMLVTSEIADLLVTSTTVRQLTFSIDGATKETCESIRRGLDFSKLLANIARVAEVKLEKNARFPIIGVNFVAMRKNSEEIVDLINLASGIGIESIRVNYATIEGELSIEDSLFSRPDLQKRIWEEARSAARKRSISLKLPPHISDPVPAKPVCTFPWDCMIIDTDGTVRLCYCSWDEKIGNIFTDGGIQRVWNNTLYKRVRSSIGSACPHYRYCAFCGRNRGYSSIESHVGKTGSNAHVFSFRQF